MSTIKSYTDLSQSRKLAEILPLESADNVIVSFGSREGTKTVVMPKETLDIFRTPFADIRETTMCWSLAALLGVLPEGTRLLKSTNISSVGDIKYHCDCPKGTIHEWYDNPVDACYEMIIHLHEQKLL